MWDSQSPWLPCLEGIFSDVPKENLLDEVDEISQMVNNCSFFNPPPIKVEPLVPIESHDLDLSVEEKSRFEEGDSECRNVEQQLQKENVDHELLKLTGDAQTAKEVKEAKKRRTQKYEERKAQRELERVETATILIGEAFISTSKPFQLRVATENRISVLIGNVRLNFSQQLMGDGTSEILVDPVPWLKIGEYASVTIYIKTFLREEVVLLLHVVD